MERQENYLGLLPISAFVVLLGLGGYLLYDQPFVSLRPDQPPPYPRRHVSSEGIDARLWEDPFKPVFAHEAPSVCSGRDPSLDEPHPAGRRVGENHAEHELRHLAFEIRSRLEPLRTSPRNEAEATSREGNRASFSRRLALLPVMVPGDPYAEQAERRRRMRHAVLAGLAARGYVPEASELIGYVETCWDAYGELVQDEGRPVRVPFEWFVRDRLLEAGKGTTVEAVLVLWLDETEFREGTLDHLDDLLGHLVGYCYPGKLGLDCLRPAEIRNGFSFRLLGPATSAVLQAMVTEGAPAPVSTRPPEVDDAEEAMTGEADGNHSAANPEPGEENEAAEADRAAMVGRARDMLLEMTESYLDDPSQLFGVRSARRQTAGEALTAAVERSLADLGGPVSESDGELLEEWYFDALGRISSALKDAGEEVADSDPEWARTVARGWVSQQLETALAGAPATPTLESEAGPDLDLAASLGVDLCRWAFRPVEPSLPTQDPLAGRGEGPPPVVVRHRLCPAPREGRTRGLVEDFRSTLSEAWKKVDARTSRPSEFWTQWLRDLVRDFQTAARFGHGGAEDLSRLSLTPEDVDGRIESWALANRDRLQGTVRRSNRVLEHLEVYSSRATVSPGLLLDGRWKGQGAPRPAEILERDHGLGRFVSTTVSDDRLARAVVAELRERGSDLCRLDGRQVVALVGEQDTFYSRALGTALEAEIERCRHQRWCRGRELDGPACEQALRDPSGARPDPGTVLRFFYLRGLDGSLPASRRVGDEAEGDPASEREDDAGAGGLEGLGWAARESLERAVGPRQYDYMRRLAHRVSEAERELARSDREIRAIGIVGSDVYDKMVVLQALRKRFPRTLFFTTDLDARLCHPTDYGTNRNLLVASGHGLSLGETLQGAVPPFRDSHQTATFLAVQLALLGPEDGDPAGCDPESVGRSGDPPTAIAALRQISRCLDRAGEPEAAGLLQPRIFELGRSGPHDITPRRDETRRVSALGLAPAWRVSGSRPHGMLAASGVGLLGLGLLGLLAAPWRRALGARREEGEVRPRDGDRGVVLALSTALGITLLFVGLAYADAHWNEYGEPFELWEGISIWPTAALRLVALFLSVGFLVAAWRRLTSSGNHKLLIQRFGLPRRVPAPECAAGSGRAGWLRLVWPLTQERRRISIGNWHRSKDRASRDEPTLGARELWEDYLRHGSLRNRMARSAPLAVGYVLSGWLLVSLLGFPDFPHRGSVSWWVHYGVLVPSLFSTSLLTFFVLDALRLSRRLVTLLAHAKQGWPEGDGASPASKRAALHREDAPEHLGAELVAAHTEVVGPLILYPFITLFIMVVARASFFDSWEWPLSLVLVFSTAAGIALWGAVMLRRAAEETRQRILYRLRTREYRIAGRSPGSRGGAPSGEGGEGGRLEQLRMLIADVAALERGAFTPWRRHPIVKALLLPFGSVGTLAFLELLLKLGG